MEIELSPRRRGRAVGAVGAVGLAIAAVTAIATTPAYAASASVTVNAGQALATIPAAAFGMNTAVYDGAMNNTSIAGLMKNAGITMMRYPGGSYADIYHWQTGTADKGGFVAPNTGFDAFMGTVKAAGAQAIVTANYGSGTPQEAANWVKYANITKSYGVKYWEVGNEVYGNGLYSNGSGWENDNHSSKTATTYANNLVKYATAMKAADPTIKIGAVLATPHSWPDGIVGPGDTKDWNNTVLSIAGSKIDFVIVHWYPCQNCSLTNLLGAPQSQIATITSSVRTLIRQYVGSNAAKVGIAVTETEGLVAVDTQPAALFAADTYLTFLENGAFNVDWWDLHNGTDCSKVTTISGGKDYNDGGVLSSGASCEPPLNTPFAPYYGIQMMTKLAVAGDTLVQAKSTQSLLSVHAAKRANGDVDVMLINKDPNNAYTVSLAYSGATVPSGTPTVYTYPLNGTAITSSSKGTATSQTVPAYSIVTIQLHARG